jgi:hypothetical protein
MFGYVAPLKGELKVREYEVYSAFYCAICHSVKNRYGELPRLLLSYDSVFLALLATSLAGAPTDFRKFRCFTNPGRQRNEVLATPQIDYAADMLVLLGYLNLKDDKEDDGRPLALAGEFFLRAAGKRAAAQYPEKTKRIAACLYEIDTLEKENCASPDRVADPFGRLMSETLDLPQKVVAESPKLAETLRLLGYHLGRYIYLIDAVDDLEKDRKSGAYNPLLARQTTSAEMAAGEQTLNLALELDLARMADALGALPLGAFKAILENVVYLGLNATKDETLSAAAAGGSGERGILGNRREKAGFNSKTEERRKRRRYLRP